MSLNTKKRSHKSRVSTLAPKFLIKKTNILSAAFVGLLFLLALIIVNHLSISGRSSFASNTSKIEVGEAKLFKGVDDKPIEVTLESTQTAKSWFSLRKSKSVADMSVTIEDSGIDSKEVKAEKGQTVQIDAEQKTYLTVVDIKRDSAQVALTSPNQKISEVKPGDRQRVPGDLYPEVPEKPAPGLDGGPTPAPGSTPGSANMLSPTAQSVWPQASLQTIKWKKEAVTAAGVGIYLMSGTTKTLEIAWPKTVRNPNGTYSSSGGLLRNNGAFDWFVPAILAPGSYQVRLVNEKGETLFDSSSFTVTARSSAVTMVSPTSNQLLRYDNDFLIKWNPPRFADRFDVAVYNEDLGYNGLGFITKNMPKEWLYVDPDGNAGHTWSVGDNTLPQANGNGPTTIAGNNIWIIVAATDRSMTVATKIRIAK